MAEQQLPTPGLLAEGWQEGEGGWLIFDWLDDAESLWDAWRAVETDVMLSDGQGVSLAKHLN